MGKWWVKGSNRKYRVNIRLEIEDLGEIEEKQRFIAIEIKWEGTPPLTKFGFRSFSFKSLHQVQKTLKLVEESSNDEGDSFVEFDHTCTFSVKDPNSFHPWFVSFNILAGKGGETTSLSSRSEVQVIGKATIDLGELASKKEPQIQLKIPITLHLKGVALKSNLKVVIGLAEMRTNVSDSQTNLPESLRTTQNSGNSENILKRAKSHGSSLVQDKTKKKSIKMFGKQLSLRNLAESSSVNELGTRPSLDAHLETKENWFRKWKRRRSMKKTEVIDSILVMDKAGNMSNTGSWEVKELLSRDKKTRLKADVFLASYDQRDKKAGGEGACSAIVVVIAHWLLLNPGKMPNSLELDHLITEGSTEWRKLCEDHNHKDFFPDRHFDLDTILRAKLRPLIIHQNDSRIGFFHPERFEDLKGNPSFDNIWEQIHDQTNKNVPRVYIVSWNDHFFVLKIEANANYIIDSLGERLHEGCTQAYILRFDDASVMYEEEEGKSVICEGKECCKEYMKIFLAGITLKEFKEAEEAGRTIEVTALYQRLQIEVTALNQRLQIDFNLSSPSCSSVEVLTASTSVSASTNTSPNFPCK